jgi:hypothetical protein
MQAVLKGLHSIDIADLENYAPDEEDNFGFALRAMVGPMNREGEESVDITVCTPFIPNSRSLSVFQAPLEFLCSSDAMSTTSED